MEVTRRSGRRRKQLLDDLEGKGGYWKLKEALDRPVTHSLWKSLEACRKTDYRMNERIQANVLNKLSWAHFLFLLAKLFPLIQHH